MSRRRLCTMVDELTRRVLTARSPGPVLRVGIDGPCGAGKTTLAGRLQARLQKHRRAVIRACGDDFQNRREIRWQLGSRSAEGFFRHTMDFGALRRELLEPLGPGGDLRYRTSVASPVATARRGDILVLDGLFLCSPELEACFDLTVLVEADEDLCVQRAIARGQERIDDPEEVRRLFHERYLPGWRLYVDEVCPERRASILFRT